MLRRLAVAAAAAAAAAVDGPPIECRQQLHRRLNLLLLAASVIRGPLHVNRVPHVKRQRLPGAGKRSELGAWWGVRFSRYERTSETAA